MKIRTKINSQDEIEKQIGQKIKQSSQEEYLENQQKAILNVLEDIEEEKNKAEWLASIVRDSDEAIVSKDLKGNIISWNKGASKLYGYSAAEAVGRNISLIVPPEKNEQLKNILKRINLGQSTKNLQTTRLRKDKQPVEVSIHISPIRDYKGKVIGASANSHDITKEKAIDKAKTEFVSLASHQLRTPLSAIKWYTEMLLDGDAGKINAKQKKFLDEIYHGGSRMVELVNDMLNVSRLEMGTFIIELKPTNIPDIAESVIKESMSTVKSKGLRIKKEYDSKCPIMYVDPKLTRIILENLLSNAVKYTPRGGLVTIAIKPQKSYLLVKVADTGGGIPKHSIPHIFTRFFRADNAQLMDPEGSGLGLYIVKTIVDHAGCKIWFKSEEKKGTIFYLTIPLTGMREKEGTKELI